MVARRSRLTVFLAVLALAGVAVIALWVHVLTTRGPQLIDNLPIIAGCVAFVTVVHVIKWKWSAAKPAIDTVLIISLIIAAVYLLASEGLNGTTAFVSGLAVIAVVVDVRERLKRRAAANPEAEHEASSAHTTKET